MKLFLATAALLLASPAWSNTLIDNVNGMQVGPDGKLQRFNRLLIDDNGKVVQTIAPDVLADIDAQTRIDGGGRTLLPGLIDAHGHVMALGFAALHLDLTGAKSLAELQQRLKAYADANPKAPWILGHGWNQELWAEKSFPTAADIDAIVNDRPVWLGRVDGHAAIANSAAMKAAGVSAGTVSPSGGRIENGLFVDAAMALVEAKIPAPSPAHQDAALVKSQELMLSVGLTAAADMGTTVDEWATLGRAGQAGSLKARIISYAGGTAAMQAISGGKPSGWLHADRVNLVGVKLYADGALGSRGAWLKRPYHDQPDTRGLRITEPALLAAQAGEAAASGHQVAIHAIGDAANADVLSIYEQLTRQYGKTRRWRIEHAQVVDAKDISRFAAAGMIASMQPVHQTSDRLMAEKRLGPERLHGAYAWQSLLKSGAKLAFGSDFPVESPNPFAGLAAAISRQDMNGQPPGGWMPEERLTFEQALSAFTRDAALASFAEDRIGSLEPGKWADFIIVDRDPAKADAQALASTEVLETWVAGKKVWSAASGAAAERGK